MGAPEGNLGPHDVRDAIVDYMAYWTELTDMPCKQRLGWSGLETNKFHAWKKRYGNAKPAIFDSTN